MNQVELLGRLGKDPDLAFAKGSGVAYTNFSIALQERKTKLGENQPPVWVNCTAFGKIAETISTYLVKGSQIALTGRLKNRNYVDNNRAKRTDLYVVVENFEFVGDKNTNKNNNNIQVRSNNSNNHGFSSSGSETEFDPFDANNAFNFDDGDMPF